MGRHAFARHERPIDLRAPLHWKRVHDLTEPALFEHMARPPACASWLASKSLTVLQLHAMHGLLGDRPGEARCRKLGPHGAELR